MLSCEKESPTQIEQSFHLGYFEAVDVISQKILTEYMGHYKDMNIDVVLKKLRDEIIELTK